MTLDHSHQHNMQCQEYRGEQCLYGQDFEMGGSINKG